MYVYKGTNIRIYTHPYIYTHTCAHVPMHAAIHACMYTHCIQVCIHIYSLNRLWSYDMRHKTARDAIEATASLWHPDLGSYSTALATESWGPCVSTGSDPWDPPTWSQATPGLLSAGLPKTQLQQHNRFLHLPLGHHHPVASRSKCQNSPVCTELRLDPVPLVPSDCHGSQRADCYPTETQKVVP